MADAINQYRDTSYQLASLVAEIGRNAVALPDIQRPFVWGNTQVRNLFDSLYRGFPIGQVMFWETGASSQTKQIGVGDRQTTPRLVIVDGQQRLTALFAVMTGTRVVDDQYRERQLRLAFRPRDGRFDVPTAATDRDPEYLPDITQVFAGMSTRRVFIEFLARLTEARGDIPPEVEDQLADSVDRLAALGQYPIQAVELNADIDEESVAEVFVRINSSGTELNQADFLLTLMSVWAPEGRKELEAFARSATVPPASGSARSAFNHHLRPGPDDLVRVVIAAAFGRGGLRAAYQVLRGKDPETGELSAEQRAANFTRMAVAQAEVVDLHNWHEFLRSVEAAGFRSKNQILSDFATLASYAIWLQGDAHSVDRRRRQNLIARWFLMAQATGRYSGSAESRLEQDLRLGLEAGGPKAWEESLEAVLKLEMSDDFFANRLVADLDARSWRNRSLFAYEAALVILEAPLLFSPSGETVASRLDPSVVNVRGVERHHLFPRAWIRRHFSVSGHALNGRANRPGNASWVDWIENADIADAPPSEYFDAHAARLSPELLKKQARLHALPPDWHLMEYDEFLGPRCALMAQVVEAAYRELEDRGGRL